MKAELVAERLLTEYETPQFEQTVLELRPHLSLDVIKHLKARVDEEKLKDAHLALCIATLASLLVPQIADPEAEALAYWAKGAGLLHLSRFQEALQCYSRASAIYAAEKQPLALVGVQTAVVAALRALGDSHAALALAEETRATCLALGAPARRYLASLEMNVGVIYRQIGDPEATLHAYQRGRDIFAQLGDDINVARTDINRANMLQDMSRLSIAQQLLLSARHTLVQSGQHAQQVARVDANLGALAYLRGRYQEALTHFEAARKGFVGMDILIARLDLRRGLIYRKLNLIEETINLALIAVPIFAQNRMLVEHALALQLQGVGYQLAGHYVQAEGYLKMARDLLEQQALRARVFELDYDLASLAYVSGRIDDAQQLARQLEQQLAPGTWPLLAAQTRLLLARCALTVAEPERARGYAQAALELAGTYSLHESTIAAHHLMGKIFEKRGEPQAAWSHYQKAMQEIESLRMYLLVDEFHMGFMDDKLPIYADAVRLSQQTASPAQVLYVLNLAHTAPLLGEGRTPDKQLQRELTALREKWHWYHNQLEEASREKKDAAAIKALHPQLKKVEAELADLTYRWQAHPTSGARPMATKQAATFSSEDANQFFANIEQHLEPNEALLHYYLVNDTFQALLVTPDAIRLLPDLASTKSLDRILRGWRLLLNQTELIHESPETSLSLVQPYLARLHQALVAPLASYLAADTHLFVVMPPDWHELPLAAFFDGQQYLIERHQVSYLSAPEVLLRGRAPIERSANPQALIIGHSDGGRLTGTVEAAQSVANSLQTGWQSTLLLDEQATIDNFQAASRASDLIHLATHATFRADNPLFSWARLAGHRLTVGELYQMKLPQNPLVVLSACETGRGKARGGGLLGMGRALLAAGASGVVMTLWRVEDEATAQLMVDFYEQLESRPTSPAAALRHAQQQAIARNPHPFFWAGFIFIQS
ncbi:MAG: CHAT domain-containing protein [Ardenticatenaceae bacterium]